MFEHINLTIDSTAGRRHVRSDRARKRHSPARGSCRLIESLETRRLLSTAVWIGPDNGLWSNAANWQGNVVPAPGADVVFPVHGGFNTDTIAVDGSEVLKSLTVNGDYFFTATNGSSAIHLSDSLTGSNTQIPTLNVPVVLDQSIVLNLGDGVDFRQGITQVSPGLGITVTGGGLAYCRLQPLNYTGTTDVSNGSMEITATTTSSLVQVDAGATLIGAGAEIAGINLNGTLSSTVDLGVGLTIDSGLHAPSDSTLSFRLLDNGGTAAPTTITVNAGQITLDNPTPSFVANPLNAGDSLTLIKNNTGHPISGTFNGMPEGTILTEGGQNFILSYHGGISGQDVTLNAVAVWTGAAGDNNWNTPHNWQGDAIPLPAQDVDFPDLGQGLPAINLASDVTIGNLTIEGDTRLNGSTITLDGNITTSAGDSSISSLLLARDTNIDVVSADGDLTLRNIDDDGNNFGITELGAGVLALIGNGDTYTGTTEVESGHLVVDTTLASSVTVDAGGLLTSQGSADGITASGGTVSLGENQTASSVTSTGPVALAAGSILQEVISDGNGEQDGQLIASGASVALGGSTLDISTVGNFVPTIGDSFTLISNQTGHAVSGTFAGLSQGAIKGFNGTFYQINYAAGNSHQDVTLTVVNAPPTVLSITANQTLAAKQIALSILGEDPISGDDSTLTYTWSVTHAPPGAKPVIFSANGSNAAKAATARFSKDGTFHLTCTISSTSGLSTTRTISITVAQVATNLHLSPHRKIIARGESVQYYGNAMDQFGHAMRVASTISYAVQTNNGTFSSTGLFTAGRKRSHVIVEITVDNLEGVLGATIV
jgi:hypothetical protein